MKISQRVGQLAVKTLSDETGVTGSQVNQLIHDIGVHTQYEVIQIQIQNVDSGRQLGGVEAPQAIWIQILEVSTGFNKGAS